MTKGLAIAIFQPCAYRRYSTHARSTLFIWLRVVQAQCSDDCTLISKTEENSPCFMSGKYIYLYVLYSLCHFKIHILGAHNCERLALIYLLHGHINCNF